jgi:hypothetical protein
MKRRRVLVIRGCVVSVVLVLTALVYWRFVRAGKPYQPTPSVVYGDTDLKHTVVVPTMDTEMPNGKNVVWCASFQLAWNRLGSDLLHEPPRVANAEEATSRLNASKFSEDNLPSECFYAAAGRCRDGVVNTIYTSMQQRFQRKPKVTLTDPGNTIVAYGYLETSVRFRIPFFDYEDTFVFRDGKGQEASVTSFGIWDKHEYAYHRLRDQVNVLYVSADKYSRSHEGRAYGEFVIDPCKDSLPNQIVLAHVKRKETLAATVDHIEELVARQKTSEYRGRFAARDVLLIPNMAWEITQHFAELEGKNKGLLNKGHEGNYIAAALQTIRFRLDRSGAELASEAASFCTPVPSLYVFDHPFVIYVKKRSGTVPFFAVYVDNAELLCTPETRAATGTR